MSGSSAGHVAVGCGSSYGQVRVKFSWKFPGQVRVKFARKCSGKFTVGCGSNYGQVRAKFAWKCPGQVTFRCGSSSRGNVRVKLRSGASQVRVWLGCDVLTQGCRGQGQSGAPEADSRPRSKAGHGGTHSTVLDTASSGDWSGRGVTSSPRDVGARVSQVRLKLIPGPCRKPTMGEPVRRCSTRHPLGISPVGVIAISR